MRQERLLDPVWMYGVERVVPRVLEEVEGAMDTDLLKRAKEAQTDLNIALFFLCERYERQAEYIKTLEKLLNDAEQKLEKMRKPGKRTVKCSKCEYWNMDMDDETGEDIHRCVCDASPRLDDVTEGEDGCEYGKRKTSS